MCSRGQAAWPGLGTPNFLHLDHGPHLGSGTVGWGHALSVPCPFLGMGHQGTARVWAPDVLLRTELQFGVTGGQKQSAVPREQGLTVLCDSEVQLSQPRGSSCDGNGSDTVLGLGFKSPSKTWCTGSSFASLGERTLCSSEIKKEAVVWEKQLPGSQS